MDTVTLDGHDLDAVTFPTQNTKILVIRAPKGLLGCGYVSVDTAAKVGDALAIVSGVASYDDMLAATVRAVSPGEFTLPSVTASGMYDPGIRAVGPAPRTVRVVAAP